MRFDLGASVSQAGRMALKPTAAEPAENGLDIDENGVDRSQIRAMLLLTPEERLRSIEEFVESAMEIRERNNERPVRTGGKSRHDQYPTQRSTRHVACC